MLTQARQQGLRQAVGPGHDVGSTTEGVYDDSPAHSPDTESRARNGDGTIAEEAGAPPGPGHGAGRMRGDRGRGTGGLLQGQPQRVGEYRVRRVRHGAAGQRHRARRHAHLGGVARHRADLDLPGDAWCQLLDRHDQHLPVPDVAAAVLVRRRGPPGRPAGLEPGRPAGVLQRRHDRDGPHEDELPVVGRPAAHRQGRPVLPRHGAGRREGERSELGVVHPHVGIPDQVVSASAPNVTTLVIHLNKAVNPAWFTANELYYIQPIPAHAWAKASATGPVLDFTNPANAKQIYDFLAKQSGSTGTYTTNPLWQVVDGPYRLTQFNNTTGAYTMAPNPKYGGPHSAIVPTLQAVPYTSDTAEFNAVLSHSIDLGYMPLNDVPQMGAVKAAGYHVFGYPGWGFAYANYNFVDKTGDFNNIIKQFYIRQALAHLENEPGYIKAFFHGAGGLAYGPIPSVPTSPYTPPNALKNPYPYSVATAASLLKAHGWNVVPGGASTCAKPGTGAGECGAGIPAGSKISFNVLYASDPVIFGEQVTAWASDAKKVGINIALQSGTFNHVITVADDPGSPKTINDWAVAVYGGFTDPYYPTTLGIFSSGGSLNGGFYSNPQADKLIHASVTSSNPDAVKVEASYLTQIQPSLFQPNYDWITVWKDNVSGQPAAIESTTQYFLNPELMYLTK